MALALGAVLLAMLVAAAWVLLRRSREHERAAEAAEAARLEDVAAPLGDAWRKLVAAEGLGAHVEALGALARPAIRLATTGADVIADGRSRIGGRPDLPSDLAWPAHAGVPLAFLAQIDLAELPAAAARGLLPPDGHLWFFYVADQSAWGFDPKDAGSARVLYRPAGGALSRTSPPDGLPDGGEFAPCAVTFEAYDDLPDLDTDHPLSARLTEPEHERYLAIREYLGRGRLLASHKLLGHSQPVQSAMELECALVTGGVYCGDPSGYADSRAEELGRQQDRWRLLFQLDTDDQASMMWGDAGMLYFWIRDDDLQARRFDRTWAILQCH